MRTMTYIVITGVAVLAECASAMEQDGYSSPTLEGEFPWRAIGATAICFAGVLLAGLKNSRRTQQKAS